MTLICVIYCNCDCYKSMVCSCLTCLLKRKMMSKWKFRSLLIEKMCFTCLLFWLVYKIEILLKSKKGTLSDYSSYIPLVWGMGMPKTTDLPLAGLRGSSLRFPPEQQSLSRMLMMILPTGQHAHAFQVHRPSKPEVPKQAFPGLPGDPRLCC